MLLKNYVIENKFLNAREEIKFSFLIATNRNLVREKFSILRKNLHEGEFCK